MGRWNVQSCAWHRLIKIWRSLQDRYNCSTYYFQWRICGTPIQFESLFAKQNSVGVGKGWLLENEKNLRWLKISGVWKESPVLRYISAENKYIIMLINWWRGSYYIKRNKNTHNKYSLPYHKSNWSSLIAFTLQTL